MSETCLFCRIASEPTRPFFVLENERLIAMPALHPINRGHLVLLPRAHFAASEELPVELAGELLLQGAVLGRLLLAELGYDGFTLALHEGTPGQPIPHAHVHLIPRHGGDDLDQPKPEAADRDELTELAQRLRARRTAS